MWLILTDSEDADGPWLADGLARRSTNPVRWITGRDLAAVTSWEHRIDVHGAWFRVHTSDGTQLDSHDVHGVVNRLRLLPPEIAAGIGSADQIYASQEIAALLLSCLNALTCPMLNRPGSQGLSGQLRSPIEWATLAHRAGFKALPRPFGADTLLNGIAASEWNELSWTLTGATVLVIGQNLIPLAGESSPPPSVAASCRRLAELARCPLLGVDLVEMESGEWWFRSADPCPPLRSGGRAALDAIAETLGTTPPPALIVDDLTLAPFSELTSPQAPAA